MIKHTPGPWGIVKGEFGPVIFSGETGAMVAQPVRGSSDDERQANARLLSAAPDILDALKNCLEWMETLRSSGDAGYWTWKDDEYTKGLAAIAKATGEQK